MRSRSIAIAAVAFQCGHGSVLDPQGGLEASQKSIMNLLANVDDCDYDCLEVMLDSLISGTGTEYAKSQGSYVPDRVDCPFGSMIREARGLAKGEKDWIYDHDDLTQPFLADWLNNSKLENLDVGQLFDDADRPIRVGLAFSGGGYRAMLNGAGSLAALDDRTNNATAAGHIGGLLKASSYIVGLSGGSWLVGSLAADGWPSVQEQQISNHVWDFRNAFQPPNMNIVQRVGWLAQVAQDILSKGAAGYNITMTDIWGQLVGAELFTTPQLARTHRWSDMQSQDSFAKHKMPFPIILMDGRAPEKKVGNDQATVYEATPYEIGSWDNDVDTLFQTKYVGTRVDNGIPSAQSCVNGYDNTAFLIGASSSIFNLVVDGVVDSAAGPIKQLLNLVKSVLGIDNEDIALIGPNPFFNAANVTTKLKGAPALSLVDGGEDGENVPLAPLIQPEREVDVILAFDNSADTDDSYALGANWPDGASLVNSYERQFTAAGRGAPFPYVPGQQSFLDLGLTAQPVFFGCDRSNLTSLLSVEQLALSEENRSYPPLVVYMPNGQYSYATNVTTFKTSYDTSEVASFITNGYNLATQRNGTIDPEWRSCLGCAVVQREMERQNKPPTSQCISCFNRYCWNGATVRSPRVPGGTNSAAGEPPRVTTHKL